MDKSIEVDIRQFSKTWYTAGKSFLPVIGTDQFSWFAGKSNALSYAINPKKEGITITVSAKTDTAYVDLPRRRIVIGAKLFDPSLYTSRFGPDSEHNLEELAIAAINGAVVHEALHIAYTQVVSGLDVPIKAHPEGSLMVRKFGMDTCCRALNIIEDLYIESRCDKRLSSWLQAVNDVFFSEEDFTKISNPPRDLNDALNLCTSFKNARLREHPAITGGLSGKALGILKSAQSLGKWVEPATSKRVDLAFALLRELEDLLPPAGDGEGDGGSGEGGENESTTTSKRGDMEKGSTMAKAMDSVDELDKELVDAINELVSEAAKVEAQSAEAQNSFSVPGGYVARWNEVKNYDILTGPLGSRARIRPVNDKDFGFVKDLEAIRTLNRTPGQARDKGAVMVKSRLTRIATDGKIFAKRDAERQRLRRLEMIILVDFSSSTMGSVANRELGAAMDISKTLRSSGIAHSVYAHSSAYGRSDDDYPTLYHIYSFDMQTTNRRWDLRFEKACSIEMSQNYDGAVIKELTDKFTGKDATRYIMVLSDGAPCGFGYGGPAALEHTKKMVNDARAKKINVIGISVVESVVDHNNRIYGKGQNVNASGNLIQEFKKLVKGLVLG